MPAAAFAAAGFLFVGVYHGRTKEEPKERPGLCHFLRGDDTLHDRQLLLVLRVGSQPRHGDVVVIHTGDGLLDRTYIVKRVIATQGDRVKIDYDTDTVTVNEIPIDEPYLNPEEPDPMEPRDGQTVVSLTVPEGTVFVMGDNRNHSADSRSEKYGPIATEKILGKVILPQVGVS